MALMLVSSDINSANHNYPTNYDEAVYVAGSFPDTAPNNTCSGPGGLPGLPDIGGPPEEFADGCAQLLTSLARHRRHPERAAVHHELLPQLQPDPVRGQGGHRPDGHDGLREHRPGGGGGRAPGVLRAQHFLRHHVPGRAAWQRDAPAHDHDRRGRAAGQHRRDRPARQGQRGLGPALRLRQSQHGRGDGPDPPEAWPADPRGLALRNAAHLHPAGGADRRAGLVLADRRRPGARVRPADPRPCRRPTRG